jgi:hypothetical protein
MQISGVSLTLSRLCRLWLLRVPLWVSRCYTLFPFQAHWGRWHCTSFVTRACVFTVHVGSGPSPLSCGIFLPGHFYQLSRSWLLGVCCRSCLLQQGLFIYSSLRDSLPPLFGAQGAPPSLLCVFFVVIACYSVSFFSLGGGQSVQGAMLIWPRVVCGSTLYCLAQLVVRIFPSHLGGVAWRSRGSAPGFSI